jgi:hypothetical protein
LRRLYEAIHVAFEGKLSSVEREVCRQRLRRAGFVWHIPLNFFFLNVIRDGVSYIEPDELIFQALSFPHSTDFDKLALVAFNNSYVGNWKGAEHWQWCPAPWANHYVLDRLSGESQWGASSISADDIERYIAGDQRYRGLDARKVATNLSYMYRAGRIEDFATPSTERWWVNALFLTLDRSMAERGEFADEVPVARLAQYLTQSRFLQLSGSRSHNKELAVQPLASLYAACGYIRRLSGEAAKERQKLMLPDVGWFANSDDPFYAIYPRDPNVIKTLPRACAMLAKDLAGFDELDPEELIKWNVVEYVRRKTRAALGLLKNKGIRPTMSAEELMKITRGE